MRKKTSVIICLLCCLGYFNVSAQQKLYIDEKGYLLTDIVVYDSDDNAHTLRAMINTSSYVCSIDSSLFSSLNISSVRSDGNYMPGLYGNYQKISETHLTKLSFCGKEYHDIPLIVFPIRNNHSYDMEIGASILDDSAWEINQVDSVIKRIEKTDKNYIAKIPVLRGKKKYDHHHWLYVSLDIEGNSVYAVFNTGTNGIGVTKKIDGLKWISEVVDGGDIGPFHYNQRYQEVVSANVKAKNWEVTSTVTYVPMLPFNIVGNSFFKDHTYVIDYPKNRILVY